MREMSTDRPDTTESPISVDAGHLQLELDAVSVARDSGATDLAIAAMNLKLGLTRAMDVQLMFEPFHQMGGERGVGDLTLRNKINLWGNDGGSSAFALMPFVRLPTASDGFGSGHVELGLIAPLGFDGPADFSFGTMLEVDAVRREDAYGADLLATFTAGHDLWSPLGAFAELESTFQLDADHEVALGFNAGLTLALTSDLVLDGGVRVGLTEEAGDLSLFLGGSARY